VLASRDGELIERTRRARGVARRGPMVPRASRAPLMLATAARVRARL